MKRLNELYDCPYDAKIKDIKINSKNVKKGDLFVCIKGASTDRHNYINDAIKNGASALIVKNNNYKVPYIKVDNPNDELGKVSKKFYDNPLENMILIGVTGTDGKTTTSTIISKLLDNTGYIGTNGVSYKNINLNENNTTPEINRLYKYFSLFNKEKLKYISMEVSSEALLHNRLNTLEFDRVIFTNITEDHLNVHKDIDNYINSKLKIFKLLKKDSIVILNRDDKYYKRIKKSTNNKVLTYGKHKKSDLLIKSIKINKFSTIITFKYLNIEYKISSPLIGEFNVYNLCGAILCLFSLGYDISYIKKNLNNIYIPGRCEYLKFNQEYDIILDYAHTPYALREILTYLNLIKLDKVITVTGSAGGREKEKRKEMGRVVQELSDLVIYTMDDPRYERVDDIIDDMVDSSKNNYIRINDRKLAIKNAIDMAGKFDIVLVAGKGRDNYMAIDDKYIKYNDYDVIKKCVKQSK